MNIDRSLIEQLSHFGITVGQLGKHSLQQKIIEMYELLEQKTTQNLLLRKENDDIKLQIDTINELFSNTPLYCTTQINANQFSRKYQNLSLGMKNSKRIAYEITGKQNGMYPFENQFFQNFENYQSVNTDFKYDSSQASYENQRQNPTFQHKSVPRSNKPSQNSRFGRQQKKDVQESQEKTFRKESNFKEIKSDKILNQKIELLLLQNETILKRMNQIQINFIKGSHGEQDSKRRIQMGFDDRQTYISSNFTSIDNIRNQKDTIIEVRGLKSQGRKHYSTNNLRVYCPSVDR